MRKRNISRNLQMKVKRYLEYMNEEENEGMQRGESLIKNLSIQLQNELQIEAYNKLLSNIEIFKYNFSSNILKSLCLKFEEISLAPDEILCEVSY